ncbi:MAG: TIGR00341 family protein [Methanoregulaceae archaeon]
MKKVIITVPSEKAGTVESLFRNVIFSVDHQETLVRYTLYIPDEMLDDMIERTYATLDREKPGSHGRPVWTDFLTMIQANKPDDDHISFIEVSTPDFVISPFIDELKERFRAEKPSIEKTPIEKILASIEGYTHLDMNKVSLAAIAGIVALIGLFLNNVGIIIGAMLISPLLGPIYAFAITTAVGDLKSMLRCTQILTVLIVLLIGIAAGITFILSLFMVLPVTAEIIARMDANSIYIVMAILLGLATIIALSKGIPEGVAGVAIAAALLPPAVVTGISAVLLPSGFIKALILTLQNVVGLITGSLIGVIVLKIGPRDLYARWQATNMIERIALVLGVIIALLVAISFLI